VIKFPFVVLIEKLYPILYYLFEFSTLSRDCLDTQNPTSAWHYTKSTLIFSQTSKNRHNNFPKNFIVPQYNIT